MRYLILLACFYSGLFLADSAPQYLRALLPHLQNTESTNLLLRTLYLLSNI